MQKGHRVGGFLIKLNKEEGFLGKMPLLLPPDRAKQRRSPGRRQPWARGPGGMVAAGNRGKGAGRRRDLIPLLNFRGGGPRGGVQRPWPWRVGGGRGRRGRGGQRRVSVGEKGEGGSEHLPRPLVRAGRWWSELATGNRCGGGASLQRWRCRAEEEVVRRWGWSRCWGSAAGPLYRPSKAVGRAAGRWPWCGRPASLAGAINGVLATCERRGAAHGRRGGHR